MHIILKMGLFSLLSHVVLYLALNLRQGLQRGTLLRPIQELLYAFVDTSFIVESNEWATHKGKRLR